MTKQSKLIESFKSARIFKWNDLVTMLKGLGFKQIEGDGSRVAFVNDHIIIKLHKPHPGNELKAYAVKQVKETLTSEGLI